MKRIFEVNGEYYSDKPAAKAARGEFTPGVHGEQGHYKATIHKGPDHVMFGVKNPGRTHSHGGNSGGSGNGFPNKKRR